jgi:hypothetical protein
MNALRSALPTLRERFEQLASSWRGILHPGTGQEPQVPSHTLHPLETQWIDAVPGQLVTCLDGCVSLTYQGLPHDIILVRGESHACETGVRLAVHAFVETEVLVH